MESQGQWSKLESGGWVHRDFLSAGNAGTGSGTPTNIQGPPAKETPPSPESTRRLEVWLNSIIAGHAGAKTTYTFYEEIDKYLGPWGSEGYPIAYGKKYNVLFSTNEQLQKDPVVKDWLWKTTIILQESLRDCLAVVFADLALRVADPADVRSVGHI